VLADVFAVRHRGAGSALGATGVPEDEHQRAGQERQRRRRQRFYKAVGLRHRPVLLFAGEARTLPRRVKKSPRLCSYSGYLDHTPDLEKRP
jgi:hypothetical protein